jgi:hypothetical protein
MRASQATGIRIHIQHEVALNHDVCFGLPNARVFARQKGVGPSLFLLAFTGATR